MEFIDKGVHNFIHLFDYCGVCDKCQTPLESAILDLMVLRENDAGFIAIPTSELLCPACGAIISIINVYKNLDVSQEFSQLKHA